MKYPDTNIPRIILYQPNALKSLFFIYLSKNLMDIRDIKKATAIPVTKTAISKPVKTNPNFTNFKALAPNITGIDKKNEYSAAIFLDVPSIMAPNMVAPDREVPGTRDKT
jgi:hypothetical protein